ncbi:hypothetical protein QBC42DRAFT_338632 [Cladorrhinum samala]|uniref:Uncharacterized protein n=1 Tax=Cladorrhinum samala TaxID=585594 RepID=A0AAV9HMU2_9PEZI|nr:hypothetical protein QBC42DRAFT_338632 [Cladorrhinum samala]
MLTKTQVRRVLSRPKSSIPIFVIFTFFWIVLVDQVGLYRLPFARTNPNTGERRAQVLQAQRQLYEDEFRKLEKKPGLGAIYGGTLETLADIDTRKPSQERQLIPTENVTTYTNEKPYIFNPYPKYNSAEWSLKHEQYVPCIGATGTEVQDILVFKGRPRQFPETGFGSYNIFGIDRNLCFERETRLGQYGLNPAFDKDGQQIDWDQVNWGNLQTECAAKNKARFASSNPANEFLDASSNESPDTADSQDDEEKEKKKESEELTQTMGRLWRSHMDMNIRRRELKEEMVGDRKSSNATIKIKEQRTALLLRSFTGKQYDDNDKQTIRSLITELSLRTGGEYQVFLFVHYKETEIDIWESEENYKQAIEKHVPQEFRSITVLWNEGAIDKLYRKLTNKARVVHNGQFLPVQLFSQEFREFDHVWNWEMDSRVMGQHYDVLNKLSEFARKQPRRGLWERNERFYIPSFHGGYDSKFRALVEKEAGSNSIWGAPKVSVVKPIGPKPPVETPEEDNYTWGVGEEADLITLSPMFNPVNSGWVMRNQVWGYRSLYFSWGSLPRRATIITQVRASRKLLDIMHAEDLRGNHVASEMVTQTTALLHGLKAVYTPMPVFFDRAWSGEQLAKWFNGGPKGESGSFGSAMGWGQEGRYLGATWYYRAIPPQRLYNNWIGYEDTAIGGEEWEAQHGRTCLPSMILHPIKEVKPTEKGYSTDSKLPYD